MVASNAFKSAFINASNIASKRTCQLACLKALPGGIKKIITSTAFQKDDHMMSNGRIVFHSNTSKPSKLSEISFNSSFFYFSCISVEVGFLIFFFFQEKYWGAIEFFLVINCIFTLLTMFEHGRKITPPTRSNRILVLSIYVVYLVRNVVLFTFISIDVNNFIHHNQVMNVIAAIGAVLIFSQSILVEINKTVLEVTTFFLSIGIVASMIFFLGMNTSFNTGALSTISTSTATIYLVLIASAAIITLSYLRIKRMRSQNVPIGISVKIMLPYLAPAGIFITMMIFKDISFVKEYAGVISILYLVLVYFVIFDIAKIELTPLHFSVHILMFVLTLVIFYLPF